MRAGWGEKQGERERERDREGWRDLEVKRGREREREREHQGSLTAAPLNTLNYTHCPFAHV